MVLIYIHLQRGYDITFNDMFDVLYNAPLCPGCSACYIGCVVHVETKVVEGEQLNTSYISHYF